MNEKRWGSDDLFIASILDFVTCSLCSGFSIETGSFRNVAPEWFPKGIQSITFFDIDLELYVIVIGRSSGSDVPSPCRYFLSAPAMHDAMTSLPVKLPTMTSEPKLLM